MRIAPLGMLGMLTACSVDRGPWDRVPIRRAWLESFHVSRVDAVVGIADGDALLVYDGPTPGAVPVHVGGGGVGLLLDIAADPEGHDGAVEVDLSEVDAPTVGDVMGTYKGTGAQGAIGIGGSGRRLSNGRGASFREGHLVVGLALFAGFEWLVIREGGDDGASDEPPETWTPTPTGPTATGSTGDTGWPPPTAPSDTAPLGEGAPPSGSGCGCGGGGGQADDTAASDATTDGSATGGGDGDDDDGGGEDPGGDDGDDDGTAGTGGTTSDSSGSGSCDESSGCSHGRAVPVGVVWAGLLVRRRRRATRASVRTR